MNTLTRINSIPQSVGGLLLIGAISLTGLGAWARHLSWSQGSFVLREDQHLLGTVPFWMVGCAMLGACLGMFGLTRVCCRGGPLRTSLGWCWSWGKSHPWWSCLMITCVALGTVDVYELLYDPFHKQWGPYGYRARDDIQNWLWFGAAALGGLGCVTLLGERRTRWLRAWEQAITENRLGLAWCKAVMTPVILAACMCWLALGGIPHFSDALTYLMQGRILYSGSLWLPSPAHPELFIHSLFFLDTDGRFYGKYPMGWPAILGTFDHFHLRVLANATLAGLATLITGLVARELAGKRVAIFAALVFGLSPWVWFHGASFASHVASTCAVWGFLALFLVGWRQSQTTFSAAYGLAAGLVLGSAVLIRPGDAMNFALPGIVAVMIGLLRAPQKWLPMGVLIATGAMVGVLIYLWSNAQTTGDAFTSPYKLESRWADDWNPTVGSMLARFAFQWSDLTSRFPGWGTGGLTLAMLGFIALTRRWRNHTLGRGPWILVLVAVGIFFLFNTTFGFTNVWWGPRWLLPVTPLIAILTGVLVDTLLTSLRESQLKSGGHGKASASILLLSVLVAGVFLIGPASYLTKFWEVNNLPPHGVTHVVHPRVTAMGLKDAVVGMSTAGGLVPPDARSGMVNMSVPFENNAVIYVRTIPDWQAKAIRSFPGRKLYEIVADTNDPKGFSVKDLNQVQQ